MKFNDDITLSIADTVKDVLEGKATVKKEAEEFKPHMMYDPKTGKGYKAEKPEDHERMKKMGYVHEKPKNLDEVEEPNVPSKDANMGSKQGEAEFKKLHKGKKVGEKEDGSVVKEETLVEALNQRQLLKVAKDLEKAIKKSGDLVRQLPEDLEMIDGEFTESYGEIGKGQEMMDYGIRYLESDIKDYFKSIGEVKEAKDVDEESEKQAAYKKVFNAGLKKFGVNGIGELDDEKKKEFFNWVDKNYEAKAEELDSKKVDDEEEVNEGKIKITAFTGNQDGSGESYKKYGLKLKKVGASYGYDDVELSGPDSKLIKFAQRNLGVEGRTVREIQKELDDM